MDRKYLTDEQMNRLESLVDSGAGLFVIRHFIEDILNGEQA